MLLINGCNAMGQPMENLGAQQDQACRNTIKKLYTIGTYCPNNLEALENLFTDSFNDNFPRSLDVCQAIQSYKIIRLLSSDEPSFLPPHPTYQRPPNVLEYFVEVEIQPQPGKSMPGNNPSYLWATMKVNKAGECKVDNLSGGG